MRHLAIPFSMVLAATASAQISPNDVVIAEANATSRAGGVTIVNHSTGQSRGLGKNTNGAHYSVALNSEIPSDLWGFSSRLAPGFQWPVEHYALKGDTINGNGTGRGIYGLGFSGRPIRLHCYQNGILITHAGGGSVHDGVWQWTRSAAMGLVFASANVYDMATLAGDKVYFTVFAAKASELMELDVKSGKAKKVVFKMDPSAPNGSKPPVTFLAICAQGPEGLADTLSLVDDSGVIYEVKPGQTAWNITTQGKKGVAAPIAIAWHPTKGLIVATKTKKLYVEAEYTKSTGAKAFYTAANDIRDMAMDLGSVRPLGVGCKGSNGKTPTMIYGGSPYQGNKSFSIKMTGGIPSAAIHLVIGSKLRTAIDLKVLGAPSCFLQTQILLDVVTNLDTRGDISLPASIPVNTSVIGAKLTAQFGVADSNANNAGLTTSNALEYVIR